MMRVPAHHRSSKDIIIRGGENVPVVEVENLLSGTRTWRGGGGGG